MTVSLLPEPESERELARLGVRWRGYTEAIGRVDDLLPAGFPVCLRVPELSRPRLERLLDVLPGGSGGEVFGHYWAGCDATTVAVPLDRVIRGGRAGLVELAAEPVWRPPTTIWDVSGSWVMVSYTDSPSAYVGLTRAYPGLIEQLGLPDVGWAERSDPLMG